LTLDSTERFIYVNGWHDGLVSNSLKNDPNVGLVAKYQLTTSDDSNSQEMVWFKNIQLVSASINRGMAIVTSPDDSKVASLFTANDAKSLYLTVHDTENGELLFPISVITASRDM
jgi:hypothetical protein